MAAILKKKLQKQREIKRKFDAPLRVCTKSNGLGFGRARHIKSSCNSLTNARFTRFKLVLAF